MLDRRALAELIEQRHERAVDDDGAIAAVAGDVREVVRVQPQVERVQDEAAARDAEVRLVMLVVVPAQGCNAVATLEPELLQRHRELPRACHRLAVVGAMERLVGAARDDLAVAEECLRPPQQVRQRQLEVHHQPVHQTAMGAPRSASAISARSSGGRLPKPSSQRARL